MLTDRFRKIAWAVWVLAIAAAVVGWWLGKDPSELAPVIGWITAGPFAAEAANVGKRATYKRDHHDVPTETSSTVSRRDVR